MFAIAGGDELSWPSDHSHAWSCADTSSIGDGSSIASCGARMKQSPASTTGGTHMVRRVVVVVVMVVVVVVVVVVMVVVVVVVVVGGGGGWT
jgi:hypothetical protein